MSKVSKQKIKTVLYITLIFVSFIAGRYTVPVTETSKSEVVKDSRVDDKTKTDLERDRQKETVITEVVRPDGTKETTTRTVDNTVTHKKTDVDVVDTTKTEAKTISETRYGSSSVSISALIGTTTSLESPSYGAYLSKQFLGPIHVGGFALSSGVFGVAIGLTF